MILLYARQFVQLAVAAVGALSFSIGRWSDACLTATSRRIHSFGGLPIWLGAIPLMMRHPVQTVPLYQCVFGSESWNWQFRGDPAPTQLLRQTRDRVG